MLHQSLGTDDYAMSKCNCVLVVQWCHSTMVQSSALLTCSAKHQQLCSVLYHLHCMSDRCFSTSLPGLEITTSIQLQLIASLMDTFNYHLKNTLMHILSHLAMHPTSHCWHIWVCSECQLLDTHLQIKMSMW